MTDAEQLTKAIFIASQAHTNQLDKGGMPYILHPLHVMNSVKNLGLKAMTIAVLHDTIEDSGLTFSALNHAGFDSTIIRCLDILTHKKSVSYESYIDKIIDSKEILCYKIKMADIEHNSQITRLKGLTDKDFKRMERYQRAYTKLSIALRMI